jgi:hypothetical protein
MAAKAYSPLEHLGELKPLFLENHQIHPVFSVPLLRASGIQFESVGCVVGESSAHNPDPSRSCL